MSLMVRYGIVLTLYLYTTSNQYYFMLYSILPTFLKILSPLPPTLPYPYYTPIQPTHNTHALFIPPTSSLQDLKPSPPFLLPATLPYPYYTIYTQYTCIVNPHPPHLTGSETLTSFLSIHREVLERLLPGPDYKDPLPQRWWR